MSLSLDRWGQKSFTVSCCALSGLSEFLHTQRSQSQVMFSTCNTAVLQLPRSMDVLASLVAGGRDALLIAAVSVSVCSCLYLQPSGAFRPSFGWCCSALCRCHMFALLSCGSKKLQHWFISEGPDLQDSSHGSMTAHGAEGGSWGLNRAACL